MMRLPDSNLEFMMSRHGGDITNYYKMMKFYYFIYY